MQVIPVIDLKQGRAVHARRGDRANYLPLSIVGCPDGDPLAAVQAYRFIHPFETLYVADLDAINGIGDHDAVLAAIAAANPSIRLMVDNGTNDAANARAWLTRGLGNLVIGSETMPPPALARDLGCTLSLDFRADGFQGPEGLDSDPTLWPGTLIVMTLAKVGSGEGPDLERLETVRGLAPNARLIAAGGVRDGRDLKILKAVGVDAVLVATCLHNGSVGAAEIAAVS